MSVSGALRTRTRPSLPRRGHTAATYTIQSPKGDTP